MRSNTAAAVSVIIPTLNESGTIGCLLADLAQQTLAPTEILVIDGGSTDTTVAEVESLAEHSPSLPVRIIHSARGVGHQRNVGGHQAKGKWLYFFDADVRVPPEFIEKSQRLLEARNLESACPRYWPWHSFVWTQAFFAVANFVFWIGQRRYPAGVGACILMQRTVFASIGGFRPELLVDDLDGIYRMGKASRFAILPISVWVSDRRFREEGFWTVIWKYWQISGAFVRGNLAKTNTIEYRFGEHDTTPKKSEPPTF
ncbi:glycosyltransferase [Candidatus Woesebacteria bacterium]|nr:glycosyltransferase [Candidatus Woesebacteria bacterium]MCD8507481.1 glycosyltransferase [Candidatus Woesebacteria bacterium]MCD8526935.1 glycosyltransferase [Candidatus Woesebacteria bacterium]MCD8545835.1 glycosyltransferase [Candidatus Woesebacteria bacterium]